MLSLSPMLGSQSDPLATPFRHHRHLPVRGPGPEVQRPFSNEVLGGSTGCYATTSVTSTGWYAITPGFGTSAFRRHGYYLFRTKGDCYPINIHPVMLPGSSRLYISGFSGLYY